MHDVRTQLRNPTKIALQMSELSSSEREDITLTVAAVNVIYNVVRKV